MELENQFTVPVGIDDTWKVLLDVERVGPCMPGATVLSVDGDQFTGVVKVKVGPITVNYQGKASFVEVDEATHHAVIDASGKETKGGGTAKAIITMDLAEQGHQTVVTMTTDLAITGRPAQFGRGLMADVSNALVKQFAAALAAEVVGDMSASDGAGTTAGQANDDDQVSDGDKEPHRPEATTRPDELRLLDTIAWPIAKRAVPFLLAVLTLVVVLRRVIR
jgi:uncharacterized protein